MKHGSQYIAILKLLLDKAERTFRDVSCGMGIIRTAKVVPVEHPIPVFDSPYRTTDIVTADECICDNFDNRTDVVFGVEWKRAVDAV